MSLSILAGEAVEVAEALGQYKGSWHFAGGWAIDLFLGQSRRPHKDADVAVLRREQRFLFKVLRSRSPLKLSGRHISAWRQGERISPPDFQVFARSESFDAPDWEFLLEDGSRSEWVYRRYPSIRLPSDRAYRTTKSGIPYLAPEIILLFKAKHVSTIESCNSLAEEQCRCNDEKDFSDVISQLSPNERAWLAHAIASTHPDHIWLDALGWPRKAAETADEVLVESLRR